MSLKSISVDETPETEVHKVEKESEVLLESSQLDGKSSSSSRLLSSSTGPGLLLSPPDISTASASPGEETDHTVTEASSTTVTPSQSIELPDRLSPQLDDPVHLRANGQLRGSRGQRASCPAEATERETGLPVQRTCRRSVPEALKGESASEASPEWLKVGESIQLRPSNQSGVISYLGPTQFAAGLWVGVELDTVPSHLLSSYLCLAYTLVPSIPHPQWLFSFGFLDFRCKESTTELYKVFAISAVHLRGVSLSGPKP